MRVSYPASMLRLYLYCGILYRKTHLLKLLIRIYFYLLIHKPFVLHILFNFNNSDNYTEQYGLHIVYSLATEGQMSLNLL
jgi:hypothetical protein